MKIAPPVRPASSGYRKLIRAFPLRPIRSEKELVAALAVAEYLMKRDDLDEDEKDYLDTLSGFIEKYEKHAHPIPDASEGDVLRVLMEGRGLSQPQLAKGTGIAQSTISAVLTGSRSLTKEHVVALAKFFGVSPTVFLPRPE